MDFNLTCWSVIHAFPSISFKLVFILSCSYWFIFSKRKHWFFEPFLFYNDQDLWRTTNFLGLTRHKAASIRAKMVFMFTSWATIMTPIPYTPTPKNPHTQHFNHNLWRVFWCHYTSKAILLPSYLILKCPSHFSTFSSFISCIFICFLFFLWLAKWWPIRAQLDKLCPTSLIFIDLHFKSGSTVWTLCLFAQTSFF